MTVPQASRPSCSSLATPTSLYLPDGLCQKPEEDNLVTWERPHHNSRSLDSLYNFEVSAHYPFPSWIVWWIAGMWQGGHKRSRHTNVPEIPTKSKIKLKTQRYANPTHENARIVRWNEITSQEKCSVLYTSTVWLAWATPKWKGKKPASNNTNGRAFNCLWKTYL